jgi:hypothetical protein
VYDDDDDQRIGRVAMETSHNAGDVPLIMRHIFDGRVRGANPRVEKQVQVDSGTGGNPEKEPAKRSKTIQWVVFCLEYPVESGLYSSEKDA